MERFHEIIGMVDGCPTPLEAQQIWTEFPEDREEYRKSIRNRWRRILDGIWEATLKSKSVHPSRSCSNRS